MYNFDFVKPATIAEAVEALSGEEAQALSGGQTLLPTLKQRLAQPSDLIDLSGLETLRGIRREGETLHIGAMSRHVDVVRSEQVRSAIPALADLAEMIGDPQVRNRGTLGGSVATADPASH